MENRMIRVGKVLSLVLSCILLVVSGASAQTVSFTSGILSGESLTQPTSLQFGPDGRLYVAQQNGKIFAYTVTRSGANNYQVTATEQIDLIQQIPNHNDDGTLNATVTTRQVTGILLTGTAANPVLYVTSSDPRVGGGSSTNNDKNLDTNSGVVSRLTWNGTTWVKVDLVRGLPRSEENHSVNGLAIDKVNNILYMAQGSNTNMGAPSNNFAYLPEYAYSTAILKIDLNAIGNTTYDLPTLDDETRSNVAGADVNDPFGGNDGLNQAKLVAGGPVSIYSPGWRNNYDLVITKANKMYSFDNGPNGGWGGAPISCTNQTSEPGSTYCDGLHYVSGQGYYAGFPNPTRANRSNTFNPTNPQSPVPLGMENPAECTYNLPGSNGALTTICSSTDGMCEYTASNFANAMKGDLLATSFNGKVYRFKLNAGGNALASGGQTILASNFGSTPLDVTTQGDNDIFPGTIWVAMYGSNDIVVFEPNDFATCAGDANSMSQDDDGDGYSNGDETQNLTDKCSAASKPADFDTDNLSDLLDPDDDNDGILDNVDKFAQDANNGTTTTIPVIYTYQNTNNGGIGGWGFTGMMCNNVDNYMTHYDMDNMTVGGAAYKFTVDNVPAGDALGALNTQHYAYQMGVNVGAFPFSYVISSRVMGPFAGIPVTNFRSMGMFMGTGDQDNYLKMVCAANGGAGGIEIVKEVTGVTTSTIYNVPILGSTHVNLYMTVNPTTQMVQPSYSIGGGAKTDMGPAISVPASWLSNVLAVGFISTSRGATPFSATWDNISVQPVDGVGQWVAINTTNTCTARMENAFCQAGDKFILLGGRGTIPAESYNYTTKTWTAGANPPMQLHHFQAVEMNGLIYAVCAFTGNYPSETPVSNVYIYDPKANVWHVGMDIPAARRRGSAAAVAYNGKIYVVSGLTNGHVSGWVPYMDEFDPTTNTWKTLPDAPHSRDHFQVAIHDGKIYCIGGRNSGYGGSTFAHTIAETDIYDIANNEWTTLDSPEGDIPTQRAGVSVVTFGDEILVIGGESMAQNNAHDQTEALDCNTNEWRTLDNLVAGRHATQAIVNNFGIYTAAGSSIRGNNALNSMEAFYLYGQTTPTGTAINKGALAMSPLSYNFGQVALGTSQVKAITLSNPNGNQAILIKSISLPSTDYSVVSQYTVPFVLNPGASMTLNVTFLPNSVGTKNASLTISHTGSNGLNSIINLTGESLGQQPAVRINCGGTQYTTAASEVFAVDAYFSTGTNYSSTTQAINSTTEDALYQTERYGANFSYNVPVQSGTYTVKLHFAEIWSGASNPGVRVFDVKIENSLVIDDLDIYATAGTYNALVRTFIVSVADQVMNIDFAASINNAKISAIEILPTVATQGMLTSVPASLTFPATDVNTASQPITVTLSNTGVSSLNVTGVTIGGTAASNYTQNFSAPATLAAGASTSFTVTFNPSASGARNATMTINHTGGNSSLSIPLSGTGVSANSCGYFVEQNGLLVMEVESATSAEAGWTLETNNVNYTGPGYYTWTGPEYLHEKGHGILNYQFKINNPGKYRFKIRTYNGGTLNTHNNDVWVRFPDHGVRFEKNGVFVQEKSGWWKQWESNLNVWTYNTWAGESTYWEVYVEFPFAGVYNMEISGRTKLYSLDRIVMYRPDMIGDWPATSANPPQSAWETCPATPLVWYRDKDLDFYGNPLDSVVSVSKPGVGWTWNNTDCDDAHSSVYPGAPEVLDGRDNDCDGQKDEGAYLAALNINCGGSTYYSVANDTFESDRLYSLPSSAKYYSGIGDILNTDDDVMYKSERITSTSNNLSYNLKAIPGLYTVTLYFAEQSTVMNPGERVFDVMVEDSVIINDLDIIATVGYKTAYSYTYNFLLTDTTLNVKVVDVIGKAKINAIKVAKKANTPPTFTISGSSTYNEDFVGVNLLNVVPTPVLPYEAYQVVTYSLSPASVPFANVSINSATGQVSITSIPNMVGQQQFTITANDGYPTTNTATKTFTLKVLAVNDAPVFTLSGDVNVNEDFAGTQTVSVTPGSVPADEVSQVLTYSLSPASVSFANVSINSSTGAVSISPVADKSGVQMFTVTANDGQAVNNTYSKTFTLTINPVNDTPMMDAIADMSINEDAAIQTVTMSGISAGQFETQTISVSAVSDNVSLIANPSVSYTSANATGSMSFTPVAEKSGVAHITVTVSDGSLSVDKMFTVTVNSVNDVPVFTMSGDVNVNEDFASAQHIIVTPGTIPADEMSQVVSYSLSPSSVSFANVSINSATGEVTIISITNTSGSQAFTVTANDGQSQNNTYSQAFTLTVNAVNDAPAFTLSGNVTVNEDFATAQQVTVAPVAVPADETSQVTTYSMTPSTVSFANVSINSSTGEVTITSISNAFGSQTFTVTANDGQSQNNTYSQAFTLTVNAVNDAPAFTLSGNVTVNEDFTTAQQVTVAPAVVPADETSQVVAYTMTPSTVSFANVSVNSSTGQVTITSIANASGSQVFTVTSNDGQSQNNTYSQAFTLTVNAVNDAPAFTLSGNVTVNEDFAAAQHVTVSPGAVAADEMSQVVTYSITPSTVSFANVSINSSTGEVTITSIANASGLQAFTVTANDGQSQNDTYSQNFTLTVNAVNDAPAFTLSGNVTVNEDFVSAQHVTVVPVAVPSDETSQVVTYSMTPSTVSFANVSINSSTGEVTITSIANVSGSQIFTVTANDGQSQNNTYSQTFTLTVNSVNDAPAFTLSGNVTGNEDFATAQHITVTPAAVTADEMSQVVTYSMTPSTVSFANVSINSNTGEVTITSIANTSGTQVFTVTANDGQSQNNTFSQTFTLTVNSVNDAPAFTLSGNVTVNEDFAAAQHVILTPAAIPADEMSQTVTYGISPLSVSFANVSINSNTGEVTITAVPNAFGTQMFTVTANDGQLQNNTHSQTFTLTVNSVNDAPAFTLSGNVTVNENFATAQHVTVTPAALPTDEMSQVVTYSMSPSSVSFANVSINSNTGEITITAVANASGAQMFTVTANDGQSQNNTFLQTFTLAVNSVNNAPAFTLSGDVTMNEDFATVQHVTVSPAVVPVDELSQVVTYSMSPSSVSFANVSLNSSTGEVTITAVANASGAQMFTVTANDGQPQNNTYSQTFTLTVNSVNDVPVFTVSGGVAVNEDFSTTENVTVTPGFIPSDELSQSVVYSLSPASVSFANVSINSGTGKVTITSVANASGTQIFMIIANDGQSLNNTYSRTFTLIVNSVNDAPEFALSGDVTVNEDFASVEHVTVIPSVVPANETSQVVNYSISPLSVSFANVSINNSTGEVAITSMPNTSGSQMFTVTANDGQSQSNTYTRTFMLTVNPVNDAPVFTLSGDVTVNEDFASAQHVMITPAAIPANEISQTVTYSMTPTTVSFANVSINSNTGEVTITSVANLSGSQIFSVTANDGQSQNNTYSKTFTLTVGAVNDAPVFTLSGDVIVVEGQYTSANVSVTHGAIPADEMTQVVTYSLSPSSVGIANVSINSSTGEVTITPVPNQFGTQVFTVTANDGQLQNSSYSQPFTLIIEEGNNPPSFTTSGDVIVDEDFGTSKTVIVTPGPVRPFEAGQVVTYSLSPSSVGFANISFDSNTGKVTITSVANAYGSQLFTITADDGQNRNNLYSSTFMLTVNSVNDVPVFTLSGDINESEDFVGTRVVTVTKGFVPANEMSQVVNYSISPSVSFANVSINPTTGDVAISSIPNAYGSQILTVTSNDGQSVNNSYTAVFTLTVNPVNDQPTLNPISNPSAVLEDSGLSTINLSGISAGGGENQTLTVTAVSNNPSLLSLLNVNYTTPATLGTISYQPAPNMWGSATVTVLVNDGQTLNNTITRTFDITVTSVNDAPVFVTTQANVTVAEDFTGTQTVSAIPAQVSADEAAQVVSYSLSPASVPFANIQFNSATGEVKITSVPNASGSGTFTVTANDGQSQNNTYAQTFILTVNSVNDAPVFSINHSITVLKNFTSNEIFTVTPAPVPANEVTQTVTYSLNPASVNFANISFSSMTGSVSITAIANMSGSQTFTLTANDGQSVNNLHSEQFVFTVIDTNYQPTLNAINNPAAINEDAGTQVIQLSGITSGFNEVQVITVTAVSDNPSLIPNPIVTYINPADVGTISYAPLSNQYGVAVITVTVNDGESENNIITKSFTVTVNPVNDQPTLNAINDPSAILEDAPMQTIMMSGISAGPNEFEALVITASSSNPLLIAAPAVVYNNPDATGMLRFTPAANQFGSALITVTVNDGKLVNNTFSRTFTVTVNSVDDAPVLSDIFKNGQEDKNLGFQVGNFKNNMTDVEGDTLVKIRIVSLPDNGRLLKNGNPINAMTELTISEINLLVYDPFDEFSGVDSFLWNGFAGSMYALNSAYVYLNINNVNDKPYVVSHIPDITVNEDAAAMLNYADLKNIFNDIEDGVNMTYTVIMNTNNSLADVVIDASQTLDISFVANANGNAIVAIQAKDKDGATITDTFKLVVNSVEDIPAIFSLLTPADGSAIANPNAIDFSWEASSDADGDNLTYAITIRGHGLDTTISVVSATSVLLGGSSLFTMDSTYQWFVTASDGNDVRSSTPFRFKISVTAVSDPNTLISTAEAYPNPFNSAARISYVLKADSRVTLKIYNFIGQEVETITNEDQLQGKHISLWDAKRETSGVYFYELTIVTKGGIQGSFKGQLIKQ